MERVRCLLSCCLAALMWLSLGSFASAQFDDLLGGRPSLGGGLGDEKPVFTTTLKQTAPGEAVLSIHVILPPEHIIYATTGDFDGRTRVVLKPSGGLTPVGNLTPDRDPESEYSPEFSTELQKFHDEVTWSQKYTFDPAADLSTLRVSGKIDGQYCSTGPGGACKPLLPAPKFDLSLNGGASPETRNDKPLKSAMAAIEAAGDDTAPAPSPELETPAPVTSPGVWKITERLNRRGKPQPLEWTVKLAPDNAKAGETVTLTLTAKLDSGFHIFSMTQADGNGGTPTVAEIMLTGLEGDIKFTPDHPHETEVIDGNLLEIYHDQVTWTAEFKVAAGQAAGNYKVSGIVNSQVCNKSLCMPMPRFKFELGRSVTPSVLPLPTTAETASQPNVESSTTPAPSAGPKIFQPEGAVTDNSAASNTLTGGQGLVGYLVTAFLAGFLSLLTPCAFPMVPITVGFFLKQGTVSRFHSLSLSLVYGLAIVGTFTLLGLGLTFLFGATFLNQLANNPWMNVGIGIVFVAFGLSMLGLFELQPPSWLLTYTANQEAVGGYLGVIFMALTFTLTSFTCTFPVAGTILVAAAQGDVLWPVLGMLAFSTAFALPFVLLSIFPTLMKQLPKSGGWMYTIKVVMGFIEIGAALKFFSVADFAWNPTPAIFDFSLTMTAWAALSLVIGLYLIGLFHLTHEQPKDRISPLQAMVATAFFGLTVFLCVGLFAPDRAGGVIMPQILAFAPPLNDSTGVDPTLGPWIGHRDLKFALDVDRAVQEAEKIERPLLYDFTGVACVNCRLMEKKMQESDIHEKLKNLVLTQLYADKVPVITDAGYASRLKEKNIEIQLKWFDDVTLPSYAVVAPDGETVLASTKGLQSSAEFAAFLDKGQKNFIEWKKQAAVKAKAVSQLESEAAR